MIDEPHAVASDLRKRVSGEILFDDISRSLFSTAACMYQVRPMGIVVPRCVEDVVETLRYCNERGIPITGRGAGTSLAGQSIGSGIIIVFNKYFRDIIEIDQDTRTARVQPGVVLSDLNRSLAGHKLMFGPDPSSGKQCVIGGMIGTNAAGAHTVKYGATKDNVVSLRVVTADGDIIETTQAATDRFTKQLSPLLWPYRDIILSKWPRSPKNSSGYNLRDAIGGAGVDLTKLLCGSEGTLAMTVEATLKLLPAPVERRNLIAYFPSYEACAVAASESLQFNPAAVEMIDKTFASAAMGLDPLIDQILGEDFVSIIIYEFEEEEKGLGDDKVVKLAAHLKTLGLPSKVIHPRDTTEAAKLWRVRKEASAIFYKIEKPGKKTSFVEDVAVPVDRLSDYLAMAQNIFNKHDVKYALYGHAGSGNTHAIVLLDLKDKRHLAKIDPIAREIYELSTSLGGTLSGEHGDGFLRTPFLSNLYGDEIYSLFGKVKNIFDPNGIMNPGKVVGEQGASVVHDLRFGESYHRIQTGTALDEESTAHEIEKCHGCGTCLSYCPTALVTFDERATPRAKGNILRSIIGGDLDASYLEKEDFKSVLDYCFNCKMCLTECPTQIDIPGIVIEAKNTFHEKTEPKAQDKFIDRLPTLSALASITPTLANIASSMSVVRKPLERFFGIDSRRKLPHFHKPLYKRVRINRDTPDAQRRVIYFSGCFANFNDPMGEGLSTIEILRRNGIDVRVLDSLRCCGIAKITTGHRDAVVDDATWNVAELANYVRQGFDIIASAPSCGLALKEDYPDIVGNEDARLVSDHIFDLADYLWRLADEGKLNMNFGEVKKRVTYHNACHSTPMNVVHQPIALMKLVPGLEVVELQEDSCCGMAGTFGLKKQFYDMSMKAGGNLFEQIREAKIDSVVTTCGTCNMQIVQGTGQHVEHLAKILGDSYRAYDRLGAPRSPRNIQKVEEAPANGGAGMIE